MNSSDGKVAKALGETDSKDSKPEASEVHIFTHCMHVY